MDVLETGLYLNATISCRTPELEPVRQLVKNLPLATYLMVMRLIYGSWIWNES